MDDDSLYQGSAFNLSRLLFAVLIFFLIFIINAFEANDISRLAEDGPSISTEDYAAVLIKKSNHFKDRKKAEQFFTPIIVQAANQHDIDPALIKAIIMAESGYNPQAVSKKGAKGLMQLMPKTAEALGVEDLFNPRHNINGGVKYFKHLLGLFEGDIELALAAYNAGIRRVREHQGIPPIGATKYYIDKVFEYYDHYKKENNGETKEA